MGVTSIVVATFTTSVRMSVDVDSIVVVDAVVLGNSMEDAVVVILA